MDRLRIGMIGCGEIAVQDGGRHCQLAARPARHGDGHAGRTGPGSGRAVRRSLDRPGRRSPGQSRGGCRLHRRAASPPRAVDDSGGRSRQAHSGREADRHYPGRCRGDDRGGAGQRGVALGELPRPGRSAVPGRQRPGRPGGDRPGCGDAHRLPRRQAGQLLDIGVQRARRYRLAGEEGDGGRRRLDHERHSRPQHHALHHRSARPSGSTPSTEPTIRPSRSRTSSPSPIGTTTTRSARSRRDRRSAGAIPCTTSIASTARPDRSCSATPCASTRSAGTAGLPASEWHELPVAPLTAEEQQIAMVDGFAGPIGPRRTADGLRGRRSGRPRHRPGSLSIGSRGAADRACGRGAIAGSDEPLMNAKVVVGLIGAGYAAGIHARAYRKVHGVTVELRAVVGNRPERAAAFAAEFGIPQVVSSIDELLADPAINLVDICAPNSLHAELAIAAANHGKHVVVEKALDGLLRRRPRQRRCHQSSRHAAGGRGIGDVDG